MPVRIPADVLLSQLVPPKERFLRKRSIGSLEGTTPMQIMKSVKFVCTKCKAEDNPKFHENEAFPPAINCWKCGAGRGKSTEEQIRREKNPFTASTPHRTPSPSVF